MSRFRVIWVLAVTYVIVYLECAWRWPSYWTRCQVDLLPAITVDVGLSLGVRAIVLIALFGGLSFDSLSANPLGVSVLPLTVVGLALRWNHALIVRDEAFAQCLLGAAASGIVPLLTLIGLQLVGQTPLLGWFSLWQWFVLVLLGGVATPVLFVVFEGLNKALSHPRLGETSFRPDREIARGRH